MFDKNAVIRFVEAHQQEAIDCLLEALSSPSPTGQEKPMADTVLRWLKKLPVTINTYEYEKDRPNYVADWTGAEPGRHFLFNGHMDVFPATETDDPGYDAWHPEIRDGMVYARGASDMKSGDTAAIMAVKFLSDMGFTPKGTITLNFVSDEENGGAMGVLSLLKEHRLSGDVGISMEPSDGAIIVGHGGVYPCRIVVYGDGGHCASPIPKEGPDIHYGGEDAIKKAVRAVNALNRLAEEIQARPATPYGGSNLSVSKISAGTVVNNYARRAEICIDRRYSPAESPATVDAEITACLDAIRLEDPTFTYEFHSHYEPPTPACIVPEDSDIVRTLDAVHEELYGEKPLHKAATGGADAAYIHEALGLHMPWYGPGVMDMLATTGEHVVIERYLRVIEAYMLTLLRMMS